MSKQKDTSNYFDDWEAWPDSAPPREKQSYKMQQKTADNGLDDFFDVFDDASGRQRNRTSGRRRSDAAGRGNELSTFLKGAAALACLLLVCTLGGLLAGLPGSSPSESARLPVTSATERWEEPDVQTVPQILETKPEPVPQKEYRYFGRMLNAEQKKIYDMFQEGIARRDTSIGPFKIQNLEDVQNIIQSVCYDYPEYFWFRGAFSSSYYDYDTYLEYTVNPEYQFGLQECAAYESFVEAAAQPILNQLAGKSDYEKVKGVYEYLVDNTAYDLNYTGTTIYEMFHDHRGVCEGYARATQYLLTKLGVETLYCTGISGEMEEPKSKWESHAWNIVKIDGIYYGIDTTWGDPLMDDGSQVKNMWYLNLTDEEIERRHERDEWNQYPACTDTRYNYYMYEGYYLHSFDQGTITNWFQETYANNEMLEFKCADEATYRQAYSWLVDQDGIVDLFRLVVPPNEGFSYSYGYSDDVYVMSIIKN